MVHQKFSTLITLGTFLCISLFLLSMGGCTSKDDGTEMDWLSQGFVGKGFTDNHDGTVIDINSRLLWMKCSYGQVYNAAIGDCGGIGGATTWGAKSLAFCEAVVDFSQRECVSEDLVNPIAKSGPAYTACANDMTGGASGWRLPTKEELSSLTKVIADYKTLSFVFPQTPDDKSFWTATAKADSSTGDEAYGVSFASQTFGATGEFHKANSNLYIRCVKSQ